MTSAPEKLLRAIPIDDVLTTPVGPIKWSIDGLVPRGHVTVLGAHGGLGKSVLGLTWLMHSAAGRDWAGRFVPVQRVAYVSFEDGPELVRARVRRIVEAFDVPADALANAMFFDATDAPPLMLEDAVGRGQTVIETLSFEELREVAMWCDGGLLLVDNASDCFAGNENSRAQVRQFMRGLGRLARDYRCAVVLLLHIAKTEARNGAKAGESYAGSTAWHNSARSRLALVKEGGRIELRHDKCNVARCAEPIPLRWSDAGLLLPVQAGSPAETAEIDRDAERVVAAMRAAAMTGDSIGTARKGPGCVTAALRTFPEELGPELMRDNSRLWRAVNRLEAAGRIRRREHRTADRKVRKVYVLCRTDAELAQGVAA
jgi:KaiC/GvpD/RAD55 family RecA-like ATPase